MQSCMLTRWRTSRTAKLKIQCTTYNTVVSFTYDDLLLGSKPHNHLFIVINYIRVKKSSVS